ncbi:hypothetical protein KIH39_24830 [Telmatocola sphagniphila]|uniref:Uncharacterized protein n=1 Tax=Telmatocola sphagniphila TaxID=1123043 RepID=A0A8E6B4Z6_9BACT|nr:hypothetical protein [Telmatocola sphagniphila]QVL32022.1 hypothetical protein KIH39_24830 [Telmatocola sphagniphila]
MPLFLIDPPSWFYYLLAVIALIGLFTFYKNQTGKSLAIFAGTAFPLLITLLIDYAIQSPREQIVKNIQAIAAATQDKQIDRGFEFISSSINYRGHNKESLRAAAMNAYNMYDWRGAKVWDFTREEFSQDTETTATQGFMTSLEGGGGVILYCKVKFVKEKDGVWRVTHFAFYNPLNRDKGTEETIPGL